MRSRSVREQSNGKDTSKMRGKHRGAGTFAWKESENVALGDRGQDVDGDRAEFITVVRAAEEVRR